MKIFTINSGYPGCNYVRTWLPTLHNGFHTDRKSIKELTDIGEIDVDRIKKEIAWADIVVFHRPENDNYHRLADYIRAMGKKIVVDNDDTFKLDDYHPLANLDEGGYQMNLRKRNESVDSFVKHADMVTCSTEFLSREYKKLNDNVIVLPNCVDPDDWDEPLRNEGKKVRIGIIGSSSFVYDFEHVKDVIKGLNERDDVQLFLFGLGNKEHRKKNERVSKLFKEDYKFWDSLDNIEWEPWCKIHEYPTKLNEARLDFIIIPRKNNYFNRCKSNIKFLEAGMLEIPVIAESFDEAPYEEIEDGVTGILCKQDEWEGKINEMIKYKEMRRKIGKNAKEYVLKNYNIADNSYKWVEAYKTL